MLKALWLFVELISACVTDDTSVNVAFGFEDVPVAVDSYDVTMSATVTMQVDGPTLDCLSVGLAEMGW